MADIAGNPCLLAQWAIDTRFKGLGGKSQDTRFGALEALLSTSNRSTVGFQENQALKPDASNKIVTARYMPFVCDVSDVSGSDIDKCDLGSGEGETFSSKNYAITLSASERFTLDEDDFRANCETPSEFFAISFSRTVEKLLQKLDRMAINRIISNAGAYSDSTDSVANPKTLNIINTGGAFNPIGLVSAGVELEKNGAGDVNPIIVGAGHLSTVKKMSALGGVNANGVNTASFGAFQDVYVDDLIDRYALSGSDSRLLAWVPGALQLISWNEFGGDYSLWERVERGSTSWAGDMGRFKKVWDTVQLLPGLEADLIYEFDCGKHTWALVVNFDVVGLPSDLTCGDYVLNFLQGCGDFECATGNGEQ